MSKARTLASTVSNGAVLADGTIDAAEIGNLTLPTGGDIVGTTATQTLTGKTINIASNTLTGVVGETATQTLTNKTLTSPIVTQNIQVISTNTTAVRSSTYVFTATLTLTLPASPAAGDTVMFSNRSDTDTPVIGRNGQNIMGVAEDLTVDNVNYFATLVFADATRGWIFQ